MIYQNDKNCLPIMQTSGCFVRSCGLVAEEIAGSRLTAEQINDVWKEAQQLDYIGSTQGKSCGVKLYEGFNSKCTAKNCSCYDDCDFNLVKQSAPIINLFLGKLNAPGKLVEIGITVEGRTTYYGWVQDSLKKNTYVIRKIKQPGPQGTHFVFVSKSGVVDPHDPPLTNLGTILEIVYSYLV